MALVGRKLMYYSGGFSMAKKSKDYFGFPRIVSVIFAIFFVTSWLFGFITRFQEKKPVAGLLRLLLGWNIIWILDLISIIFKGKILRLINC